MRATLHLRRATLTTVLAEDRTAFPLPLRQVRRLDAVGGHDGRWVTLEVTSTWDAVGYLRCPATFADALVEALHQDAARRERRHRHRRAATAVALVLAGVLLVDVGLLHARIDRRPISLPSDTDGVDTWLLIGSDDRRPAQDMPNPDAFGPPRSVPGERADVVLLLQRDPAGGPSRLVSVPRDLLVFRSGHGIDRLAMTLLDGPEATATSICKSLGIGVDHVAVIRFDGVRHLVDLTGGLVVFAEHPTRDRNTGLELRPGPNWLDGAAAVAWVRSRHLEEEVGGRWVRDASSDRGRQHRARVLLRHVTASASRAARHPVMAQRVAWTAAGAVRTDARVGPWELLGLLRTLTAGVESSELDHVVGASRLPVATLTPQGRAQLDELRSTASDGPPCPRAR
jgi:LCP family protein required for cell wall assembly